MKVPSDIVPSKIAVSRLKVPVLESDSCGQRGICFLVGMGIGVATGIATSIVIGRGRGRGRGSMEKADLHAIFGNAFGDVKVEEDLSYGNTSPEQVDNA